MEHLSQCATHGRNHNQIVEIQNRQCVEITSNLPLVVYQIMKSEHFWAGDNSPDAVIIAQRDRQVNQRNIRQETLVCFVELKTKAKRGIHKHSHQQLEMGISHFAPFGRCEGMRSHGDSHHDRWSEDSDALEFRPDSEHKVRAIQICFREGSRSPKFSPRESVEVCGKRVRFSQILLSQRKPRGIVSLTLNEFCRKAGL